MKKIVAIIIVLLAVASLCACNETPQPLPEPPPSLPVSESPAATGAAPVATTVPPASETPATPTPAAPTPAEFRFTMDNMPRIDGSTANIPLIGSVYSVLLGIPRAEADAMVSIFGTDNAYNRLRNGGADLLLVYGPSPDTSTAVFKMAPIGRDGLVFLVNKLNRIDSLTPDQLVQIYSGEVTNWRAVGGENTAIKAFQRQHLSGSQTMMDALVMKGAPMADPEEEYEITDMGGLVSAIANYNNAKSAIGYNVFYFVTRMALDPSIKLLKVDGVAPTTESISDGTYPFVADFYVVIRADEPANSPARILFDWMQSADGQSLVASEGYSPITG